eukprot:m.71012 g.71012  ORF g.71012 m.71012 type:complete len:340 (+) comp14337_c0_seq1:161-1180(+)
MDFEFVEEERVLCYHQTLLYEAKVLKTEVREMQGILQPAYFVHYNGWNKKWDEWVLASRMKKYNDVNVQHMQQMQQQAALEAAEKARIERERKEKAKLPGTPQSSSQQQQQQKKPSNAGSTSTTASASGSKAGGSGGGSGGGGGAGSKGDGSSKGDASGKSDAKRPRTGAFQFVKVPIPQELKDQLANDWNFVVNEKMLVPLPRTPSLRCVLEEFRATSTRPKADVNSVVDGLRTLFCTAVGQALLYSFERVQYMEILEGLSEESPADSLADVYGAEHLLRLLVKLPDFLKNVENADPSMPAFMTVLTALVEFLRTEKDRFFVVNYDNATHHYIRQTAH